MTTPVTNPSNDEYLLSRREFVVLGSLAFVGFALSQCKRSYVRPGEILDLGDARSLLYPVQHVRQAAVLLSCDEKGWSALSTRCTFDGCDLTFQEDTLLCSCCKSRFTHDGRVRNGPAQLPLPWYELMFENSHLLANSGKRVERNYRFAPPQFETEFEPIRRKVAAGGVLEGVKVPDVLAGHSDGEIGPMFKDFTHEGLGELHELPDDDRGEKPKLKNDDEEGEDDETPPDDEAEEPSSTETTAVTNTTTTTSLPTPP